MSRPASPLSAATPSGEALSPETPSPETPSREAPVYRLVKREGPDHAPHFRVEVSVSGEQPETGEGQSKREAEQAAAAALLARVRETS